MTAAEAYQILNVPPGASPQEIQRAYVTALQALQLQLVPGQPLSVRRKAQDQIAQLKTAFEFMRNMGTPGAGPARVGAQPQGRPTVVPPAPPSAVPRIQPRATPPIPPAAIPPFAPTAVPSVQPGMAGWAQPPGGFSVPSAAMPLGPPAVASGAPPPGLMPNPFSPGQAAPTYPWIIPAGFVLAAVIMLFVVVLCIGSTASQEGQKTARLRVLSVPWSQVTVDGKSLGPSGQLDAFVLKPGDHEIVLRQGERVLSRTVYLPENSETIFKAQFEKEQTHVARQRI